MNLTSSIHFVSIYLVSVYPVSILCCCITICCIRIALHPDRQPHPVFYYCKPFSCFRYNRHTHQHSWCADHHHGCRPASLWLLFGLRFLWLR